MNTFFVKDFFNYSAGVEFGIGVVGFSYGIEKTTTTSAKGEKKVSQKSSLELNLGPASYISTTFENIDPKTNKTIPGSSSNSTGVGLFETSAKVGLGFKAELKGSVTIGMGGEIRPVKPIGIAPTDATSTANQNINLQQFIKK